MSDAPTKEGSHQDKKAREGRSPGFPFVDLKKALERAEAFRLAEGKHAAPAVSARKAWKLGDGVIARRTIAALTYFQLFDDEGSGEKRVLRLSDSALKILLDKRPTSPEREELIRATALKPALHKELWDKWGPELPSDATFETYLVRDRGFSSAGAGDLITEYKATLSFAKLRQSDAMSSLDENEGGGRDKPEAVSIGDLVQAEIGGSYTLPKAARVRAIKEDQGSKWVFVEGSETGIPMERVIVQAKGPPSPDEPAVTAPRLPLEVPTEVAINKSEREWLRGPLSKESSYRLIVSGDLGPKEIGKLIKLLEAQKAVLADDDADE